MILGVDLLEIIDCHPGIDLGGLQRLMAKQLLNMTDGRTVLEHVGCTAVPECMSCHVLFDSGKSGAACAA